MSDWEQTCRCGRRWLVRCRNGSLDLAGKASVIVTGSTPITGGRVVIHDDPANVAKCERLSCRLLGRA